mmetsp:Transcript_11867/g.21825  ORF Transcript_11867/g.21825 Transcript_11867/m.21825 type:complete len:164 (-) Transcript_11867:1901-2392(-)
MVGGSMLICRGHGGVGAIFRRLFSTIDRSASIVDASVVLGADCQVGANAVIGPDVVIGDGCVLHAGCVVQNAVIGDRVTIHPGACLGQDGFGFHIGTDSHEKKPQELKVVVHDEVEIGANTTIDRGSWRDTTIGKGTKIDNLVSWPVFFKRYNVLTPSSNRSK